MSGSGSHGRTVQIGGRAIELSRLDKVLFPDDGITKGELIDYYRSIADTMLPHLQNRALTMHRYPDGLEGEDFYQKDAPDYFPDWIRTEEVEKEEGDGTVHHVVCNDAATLCYLANQATITPHVWLSRVDRLRRPDRMIFDLDPGGTDLGEVRFAARAVRDLLEELELQAFLMTTGSRGYHVVVPLRREHEFDEVRAFARACARLLASRAPDRLTVEHRKKKRGERVFLDYLRNGYAQTGVAPYAVRARPGAPVATPVRWHELGPGLEPRTYHIGNLFRRLGQTDDPWRAMDGSAASLGEAREDLDGLLDDEGFDDA